MAKPEWGIKRICLSCAAKFYDFDKAPIVCPKCSAEFDPEALLRVRRGRADKSKDREAAKPAPTGSNAPEPKTEDEIEDVGDDDGNDADGVENTDDLDDDEDVPGVDTGKKDEDS